MYNFHALKTNPLWPLYRNIFFIAFIYKLFFSKGSLRLHFSFQAGDQTDSCNVLHKGGPDVVHYVHDPYLPVLFNPRVRPGAEQYHHCQAGVRRHQFLQHPATDHDCFLPSGYVYIL